jgi:hypothetical protein
VKRRPLPQTPHEVSVYAQPINWMGNTLLYVTAGPILYWRGDATKASRLAAGMAASCWWVQIEVRHE